MKVQRGPTRVFFPGHTVAGASACMVAIGELVRRGITLEQITVSGMPASAAEAIGLSSEMFVVLVCPPWPAAAIARICEAAAATIVVVQNKRTFLAFGAAVDQDAMRGRQLSVIHRPGRHIAEAMVEAFEGVTCV